MCIRDRELIARAAGDIYGGCLAMRPVCGGGDNACAYCAYHSICRFDEAHAANRRRRTEPLKKQEVLERIEREAVSYTHLDVYKRQAYIKEKYQKPGEVYLGLVHRLDRPAGGVMVFARTSKAAARLAAQMQAGRFQKTYLAVVTGNPPPAGDWDDDLLKDEKSNTCLLYTSRCV